MSEFWNQIIQAVAPLLAIGIALDLVSTWAVAERKRRRICEDCNLGKGNRV